MAHKLQKSQGQSDGFGRQEADSCGNCQCFRNGICCSRPPTPIILPVGKLEWFRPAMKADDWCAQHKRSS